MTSPSFANRKSKDIVRALMDPAAPEAMSWSSGDLRAILDHQLDVPLAKESDRLAEVTGRTMERISSVVASVGESTYGSVLDDPDAGSDALALIKDFAKAAMANDDDLPREVARVLYVLAIGRARLSGFGEVSSLDDSSIDREIRRCLTVGWLSTRVRAMLRCVRVGEG